jgi:hypothetical protein
MSAVLIVMIVFSFVAFIVKMGLDHDRATKSIPDNSVTASELRRLIAESVNEATADLQKRLDRLEGSLPPVDAPRALPPAAEEGEDETGTRIRTGGY